VEANRSISNDPQTVPGRDLFLHIGEFLGANGLDPTPAHYDLAYRYATAADPALVKRIDETIATQGRLTALTVAGIVAVRDAEISANELARAAEEAQAHLRTISAIVDRSGREARDYGDALERISDTGQPLAVEGLLSVTRAMIAKTRHAEEDLRRSGEEMEALRASLAEARRSADTDALTGLPNRRALDARLRLAIETARAERKPLSLAICDIDLFKQVNDLHGHHIGDEVIKFIAGALSRSDVERLFVARYGGEEFVMLFEGLNPDEAARELNRIRGEVGAREFKVRATGRQLGKLSFSAGVAAYGGKKGPSVMLKLADGALYRAKQEGRNRVCIAD
jgi:diguanylate cyclase